MSIVALSIDALLPALPDIGNALDVDDPNKNQRLITMIFLGLGCGQLILGPLSDSFGRKPVVYIGFIIFAIASYVCLTTKTFEVMIAGRILQGVGLSAMRTVAIAMVRDLFDGDYMAKILSIVVMTFILVPVIAPTLGQWLMDLFNWQSIFIFNLLFSILILFWFWKRQEETLKPEFKIPFTGRLFIDGTKEFFRHKDAVAYTLVSGFITGSFMVWLSTSQQIFEMQYNLKAEFPYIFASLAIAVGFSTFTNSRIVIKYGMWNIADWAISAYAGISLSYVVLHLNGNNPSLVILLLFFGLQFFSVGFIFGNMRALAMQPLGHIAGIGAAINGFISTVMAVPIADYIGSFIDTSVLPIFVGFTIFGLLSLLTFLLVKTKNG